MHDWPRYVILAMAVFVGGCMLWAAYDTDKIRRGRDK